MIDRFSLSQKLAALHAVPLFLIGATVFAAIAFDGDTDKFRESQQQLNELHENLFSDLDLLYAAFHGAELKPVEQFMSRTARQSSPTEIGQKERSEATNVRERFTKNVLQIRKDPRISKDRENNFYDPKLTDSLLRQTVSEGETYDHLRRLHDTAFIDRSHSRDAALIAIALFLSLLSWIWHKTILRQIERDVTANTERVSELLRQMSIGKFIGAAGKTSNTEWLALEKDIQRCSAILRASIRAQSPFTYNTHDALLSADRQLRIQTITRAVSGKWQMQSEQLIGRPLYEVLKLDRETLLRSFEMAQQQTEPLVFETQVELNNGPKIFEWTLVWDASSDLYYAASRDLTDRRKFDAYKAALFAMVSHDLRTPLTSVLTSLSALQLRSEHIEIAKQQIQDFLFTLNDILNLSYIQSRAAEQSELASLYELANVVVADLQPRINQKQLNIIFPTGDATIWGPRRMIVSLITVALSFAIQRVVINDTLEIRIANESGRNSVVLSFPQSHATNDHVSTAERLSNVALSMLELAHRSISIKTRFIASTGINEWTITFLAAKDDSWV